MKLSPEQKNAIARLYENESLTENLTDTDARAVLQWAQQQIAANADGKLVQAAVSAANNSGTAGAQALVAQATTFLTQQLSARGMRAGVGTLSVSPEPATSDESAREAMLTRKSDESGALPAAPEPSPLQASAAAGEPVPLRATASASISSRRSKSPAPSKKTRAKSKRKRK